MEERLKAANLEMFKVRASSAALGKWGQRAGGGLLLQGGHFLKGLGTGGDFRATWSLLVMVAHYLCYKLLISNPS